MITIIVIIIITKFRKKKKKVIIIESHRLTENGKKRTGLKTVAKRSQKVAGYKHFSVSPRNIIFFFSFFFFSFSFSSYSFLISFLPPFFLLLVFFSLIFLIRGIFGFCFSVATVRQRESAP